MIGRAQRRALWLVAVALVLAASAAGAQPAKGPPPPPPSAEEESYAQHLTNGVRLFNSGDFKTAIAEFQAAYKAVAKASPLINEALAYQKLALYPKAVAKLEECLAKHGASMSAEDRREVERTIEEMRALFAFVTIETTPKDAEITLDDEPLTVRSGVPLSPGEHRALVSKAGWVSASRTIAVASGDKLELAITLAPEQGNLAISAKAKQTPIRVDGTIVGRGAWQGDLAAGDHSVEIVGETGTGTIKVTAGAKLVIDVATGRTPLPALPSDAAPTPAPAPKRGLYGGLNGAVLFPTRHPIGFAGSASSGANVGLRGGYRVHDYAAFEGLAEYGNVEGPANGFEDPSYSLTSIRFGPQLRLMSPGDVVHFVGTIGGGLAINIMKYENLSSDAAVCNGSDPHHCDTMGADFYVMTEVGAELNFDGVLIGLMGAVYLNGTKSMDDGLDAGNAKPETNIPKPYGNSVLPMIGPRAFVGYAFW